MEEGIGTCIYYAGVGSIPLGYIPCHTQFKLACEKWPHLYEAIKKTWKDDEGADGGNGYFYLPDPYRGEFVRVSNGLSYMDSAGTYGSSCVPNAVSYVTSRHFAAGSSTTSAELVTGFRYGSGVTDSGSGYKYSTTTASDVWAVVGTNSSSLHGYTTYAFDPSRVSNVYQNGAKKVRPDNMVMYLMIKY